MSDAEFIIGWSLIAVLLAFLWLKHHQRTRNRARVLSEIGWHASGFDSEQLKPRIEQVRRNPLGEQKAPVASYFHLALLATMRREVAESDYFSNKELKSQTVEN